MWEPSPSCLRNQCAFVLVRVARLLTAAPGLSRPPGGHPERLGVVPVPCWVPLGRFEVAEGIAFDSVAAAGCEHVWWRHGCVCAVGSWGCERETQESVCVWVMSLSRQGAAHLRACSRILSPLGPSSGCACPTRSRPRTPHEHHQRVHVGEAQGAGCQRMQRQYMHRVGAPGARPGVPALHVCLERQEAVAFRQQSRGCVQEHLTTSRAHWGAGHSTTTVATTLRARFTPAGPVR